jgi:hypothetical protein
MDPASILVWNICGLNGATQRDVVHTLVAVECPSMVHIQETNLSIISDYDVMQILGSGFDYFFLHVVNMRGGILVVWHAYVWSGSSCLTWNFSVSVRLRHLASSVNWWLTWVYGPANGELKPAFL